MLRHDRSPSPRVRGQALTELAVAAAVLVPLFLLIPVVAKYTHMRQVAQQAARNAAWEATVAKDHGLPASGVIQARMLDRAFAKADDRIRTATSGRSTGAFADPMLNMFSGRKFLERDNVRLQAWGQRASPGFVSRYVGRINAPGAFPPNPAGYATAEVQFRVRDLRTGDGRAATFLAPVDRLDLRMRARQSLLADAWNASGPARGSRSVREQACSLSVLCISGLGNLSRTFDMIGALPIPILGKLDDLDLGVVEPDIVPADKLQNYPVRRR